MYTYIHSFIHVQYMYTFSVFRLLFCTAIALALLVLLHQSKTDLCTDIYDVFDFNNQYIHYFVFICKCTLQSRPVTIFLFVTIL